MLEALGLAQVAERDLPGPESTQAAIAIKEVLKP